MSLLCDSPGLLEKLAEISLSGRVHGATIAPSCLIAGVRELWTLDSDFSRFPSLRTRNPLAR
ncbi:MAG: hypothetical protein Fur0032_24230 [Terrimicrobiaceae bacterium]